MTSLILLHGLLLLLAPTAKSGFQPVNKKQLLIALYGNPCDCAGGSGGPVPTSYTRSTDCGSKTAYLVYEASITGGYNQKWDCVTKPKIIPTIYGKPGPCPTGCAMATEMHSTCYTEVQQYAHSDEKIYLTAVLQRTYRGSVEGDWDFSSLTGYPKFGQASCSGSPGKDVCWPPQAPVHISDGGGPSDQLREERVQKQLETIIQELYPSLNYHPLALPKPLGPDPDVQTLSVLEATYQLINTSNPVFAVDCWLCLTLGTPLPLALPVVDQTDYANSSSYNCSFSLPFRVQPVQFNASVCYLSSGHNNSFDIPVRVQNFSLCSVMLNGSAAICPAPGHVLVCGGSLAFTSLPTNWTGLCMVATVLPDIALIPRDEPVPLPSFDYIAG
ncbi:syncytin-1-like [Heterocephalus glaber]|uniref:Syncytin-1-like n=1 Tax=Heterocephalus glaber TaxID=10181 RepID=A0AAX6RFN5_HETGA|nr:syncytin-1-like [Heterocephalus glaber]